jgi:hypothetical protein
LTVFLHPDHLDDAGDGTTLAITPFGSAFWLTFLFAASPFAPFSIGQEPLPDIGQVPSERSPSFVEATAVFAAFAFRYEHASASVMTVVLTFASQTEEAMAAVVTFASQEPFVEAMAEAWTFSQVV